MIHPSRRAVFEEASRTLSGVTLEWVVYEYEHEARTRVRDLLDRRHVDGLLLGRVVLGIRPEDVRISTAPQPGHHAAKVFIAELLGADVLVTVDVSGELIKARTTPPFQLGQDSTVYIGFPPDKVHLFDPSDGRALPALTAAVV